MKQQKNPWVSEPLAEKPPPKKSRWPNLLHVIAGIAAKEMAMTINVVYFPPTFLSPMQAGFLLLAAFCVGFFASRAAWKVLGAGLDKVFFAPFFESF